MDLKKLFGFGRELFSINSSGHKISITDDGSYRILKFDRTVYSRLSKTSIYTDGYWDYFMPLAYLQKNPRILMIGLGGGTIAFQLNKLFGDKIKLDIVEINKEIIQIFHKFIGDEVKLNIIEGDGAAYVAEKKHKYDIIILDAYVSEEIPRVFFTSKFINDAYSCLSDEGILAINCIGSMRFDGSIEQYAKDLKMHFKVYTIGLSIFSNVLLICSKGLDKSKIFNRIRERMQMEGENINLLKAYETMS